MLHLGIEEGEGIEGRVVYVLHLPPRERHMILNNNNDDVDGTAVAIAEHRRIQ